jgi:hypothetical protein
VKRRLIALLVLAGIVPAVVGGIAAAGTFSSDARTPHDHNAHASPFQGTPAANLRVTLDRLLGEHAVLAMNATNLGVTGAKSFPAAAKALDQNSVELSKAIASVYGKKAGNTFLNGKFQWRAHVGFFVDYTVAVAKKNKSGQAKAVASLKRYTVEHAKFLAGATGLPVVALQNDLLAHVVELKAQLDNYAAGNFAKAAAIYRDAYDHMFHTGDLLAGAIAKQKNLK